MKKFYAFLAAALISVSAFAAKDVVPSDAVLAGYYEQGNVCVCIFVPADMACFDFVLTGSFNGWSDKLADCKLFEAVEGYDGWYVASFEPEAEPDAAKGMQAKPVMLDVDGKFNWDYQVGTATAIRGGVTVVQGAYEGEIDLINYGSDAPNVFTVDSWKKNPCTAVYHNYKITVVSVGCDGYAVPFVVGSFTGWGFTQMQLDEPLTIEYEVPVYTLSFKAAEGAEYQIVSGTIDDEGELVDKPAWSDDAYIQEEIEGVWGRINDGANYVLDATVEITFDLRAENLRWARCVNEPAEHVVFGVKLPAENCPEAVEVIGTFDDWGGTALSFNAETGWFVAEFEAKASQYFKFRGAGSWDQELEVYNAENDEWAKIGDNQLIFGQLWENGAITLDFSDPENYRWTVKEEGIENVVLTEKASKVVVDGVLYIVRDNKMFNVQGVQVR